MKSKKVLRGLFGCLLLGPLAFGCGSDDAAPTQTGRPCSAVEQCYPGLDQTQLSGAAECLDRVSSGYCTHHCVADSDCCKLSGECPSGHAEVCAPFESTGEMYCFLSCEDEDLEKAGVVNGDVMCHTFAGADFGCRSTGGGSDNRKVCVP